MVSLRELAFWTSSCCSLTLGDASVRPTRPQHAPQFRHPFSLSHSATAPSSDPVADPLSQLSFDRVFVRVNASRSRMAPSVPFTPGRSTSALGHNTQDGSIYRASKATTLSAAEGNRVRSFLLAVVEVRVCIGRVAAQQSSSAQLLPRPPTSVLRALRRVPNRD